MDRSSEGSGAACPCGRHLPCRRPCPLTIPDLPQGSGRATRPLPGQDPIRPDALSAACAVGGRKGLLTVAELRGSWRMPATYTEPTGPVRGDLHETSADLHENTVNLRAVTHICMATVNEPRNRRTRHLEASPETRRRPLPHAGGHGRGQAGWHATGATSSGGGGHPPAPGHLRGGALGNDRSGGLASPTAEPHRHGCHRSGRMSSGARQRVGAAEHAGDPASGQTHVFDGRR